MTCNCCFLISAIVLQSERSSTPDHTHHRLSWCPYVPQEEGDDEEDGWVLAVSHGCEVREGDGGQREETQGEEERERECHLNAQLMYGLSSHAGGGVQHGYVAGWRQWDCHTPEGTSSTWKAHYSLTS